MNDWSYSNNAEVDMGQLAGTKGTNALVKSFGNEMVQDHRAAQKSLDSVALKRNFTLAKDLSTMDKKTRDSLNGLSGAAFDSSYMKVQHAAHSRTIKMLHLSGIRPKILI
jgi:putative membrane protein